MAGRKNWRASARCRTADAEELFVKGAAQREARAFCRTCPVRTECLAHALDEQVEYGVWGGMTERERRALLRSRPDVTSWADLLFAAREAHGTPAASRHEGRATAADRAPRCAADPRRDDDRTATRSA
jgi:WhiB family redox-sensing transcriptional regulator